MRQRCFDLHSRHNRRRAGLGPGFRLFDPLRRSPRRSDNEAAFRGLCVNVHLRRFGLPESEAVAPATPVFDGAPLKMNRGAVICIVNASFG